MSAPSRFPHCVLATCCIPWDSAGQMAEGVFRRSVRRMLLQGTKHLYIFGTAGEGYAVSEQQFAQIVEVFADEMRAGQAEPMVGVVSLATTTICERIKFCRDCGVRQFQICLPSWGPLSDRELFAYFDLVCGQFSDCQFLHYNLPRAKRIVTGAEYGRLAATHPNLVATKNTGDSLSHLRSLLSDAPQLRHFVSEAGYVYGNLFGECGLLASCIMNWPRLHALWEAGRRKDWPTLVSIQREVDTVLRTLFETVPGPRIDGAYDKLYAKMYDDEFPLDLLPPYQGARDTEYREFVRLLQQRLPAWVPSS